MKSGASPENSGETQNQLWLLCPICKNPNPTGTLHCKHCWGASLYTVAPITSAELAAFEASTRKRQKKLDVARNLFVYSGAIFLILAGLFFWLYTFTDVIFHPQQRLNSASFPGEAAMYRYDLARSGATSLSTVTPSGELKWSFQAEAPILSTPVAVNDTVYIGSNDGYLYALDTATGVIRWKFKTGSWVESSPAVINGMIYFGSNDGRFYALDAATGYNYWEFNTGRPIKSSPAVADGIVYFGSFNNHLYALDARTGAIVWKYATGGYVYSSPVVANGVVYFGANDRSCYALDAVNGRFRLKLQHRDVISSPSVSGERIYFNSERYMVVMDGSARNWPLEYAVRSIWTNLWLIGILPPPPPITGFIDTVRISSQYGSSTPVVTDDRIFNTGDNNVYGIDALTYNITWTFTTGGKMEASPCLANGVVFAGSRDGRLYAIDADNGEKIWDFDAASPIHASPTYAKGVVYVATEDGTLYAVK